MQILEKETFRFVLLEFVSVGDLLEGLLGGFLVHAEELARLDPFVLRDVTVMVEIDHVERRVDALGQLLENLRIGVRLAQFIGEIAVKVKPFLCERRANLPAIAEWPDALT